MPAAAALLMCSENGGRMAFGTRFLSHSKPAVASRRGTSGYVAPLMVVLPFSRYCTTVLDPQLFQCSLGGVQTFCSTKSAKLHTMASQESDLYFMEFRCGAAAPMRHGQSIHMLCNAGRRRRQSAMGRQWSARGARERLVRILRELPDAPEIQRCLWLETEEIAGWKSSRGRWLAVS